MTTITKIAMRMFPALSLALLLVRSVSFVTLIAGAQTSAPTPTPTSTPSNTPVLPTMTPTKTPTNTPVPPSPTP